jgi:hypothetical protein
MEHRRQITIMQENLRILNRTAEIMNLDQDHPVWKSHPQDFTSMTRRNARIIFQWFIHKFGKYVPWWAQINY